MADGLDAQSNNNGSHNSLTPNQVVAGNLRRARKDKGWTMKEASERLEPLIGERWSVATFSAAENSVRGERVRHFDADLIHAFSIAFGKPVQWFLQPLREPEKCPTCGQSVAPGTSKHLRVSGGAVSESRP